VAHTVGNVILLVFREEKKRIYGWPEKQNKTKKCMPEFQKEDFKPNLLGKIIEKKCDKNVGNLIFYVRPIVA
jgi:hypothetical protein